MLRGRSSPPASAPAMAMSSPGPHPPSHGGSGDTAAATEHHCQSKAAAAEPGWEVPSCWEVTDSPGQRRDHSVPTPPFLQRCPAVWVRTRSHHTAQGCCPGPHHSLQARAGGRGHDEYEQHHGDSCPVPAIVAVPGTPATTPRCHGTGPCHGIPMCPQCHRSYVPFRALTLATRSWKPWAQRLGTSSSTISIFRPV